jgi:hypothetical protein
MTVLTAPAPATIRGSARLATLGAIRLVALLIAIGTTVAGIAYFSVSVVGPTVWWPSGGGDAGGAFVEFPHELRLVNAGAFLLWCLTTASLAFILSDLAWRIRRGVRFVPSVSRSVWALAIALAVGSTLAQITETIARQSMPFFPDHVDPATVDLSTLDISWGVGAHSFLPNGVLLGLAVVLAVLAFIIQSGERLQRDTEGLV